MLHDRGTKKWGAFMLPEHTHLLREMDWDNRKKEKPELDEQQLEIMEETICEAMEHNQELTFTYFKDNDFRLLVGKVHHADPHDKVLLIVDKFEDVHKLRIKDLIDVRT